MSQQVAREAEAPESRGSSARVGFLVVARGRGGFDQQWGTQVGEAAWRQARGLGFTWVAASEPARDPQSMRAALSELTEAGCETLILLQPTMGDGRLVPTLIQRWPGPVVLWASSERADTDRVSACTLVGSHVFGSLMRQRRHPFELVNGHPDEPGTIQRLDQALRLTITHQRLRHAQIGLVGAHAPGFLNLEASPTLLSHQLGSVIQRITLQELIDATRGIDEQAVEADRRQVEALELPHAQSVPDKAIDDNSRYYLAIEQLIWHYQLDAIAIRGWPELPNVIGTWPYLAYSRLADAGHTIAMEGDADGALTLLIGKLMGWGPGLLSDWLEHDHRAVTLWHQGEAPRSLCEPEVALDRHFNTDKPVVVNAHIQANQPVTLARLWHCDGQYQLTAVDAHTEPPARPLKGLCGRAAPADGRDVPTWFDQLIHAGMPHHIALFPGHHATELRRLARQLAIGWGDGP